LKKYLFLPILFFITSYQTVFANFYNAQTLILENGFKFVFVKNPRVEQSAHYSLIYNVGARDENADLHKTGLAHFLEHLMFHGTTLYPPNVYETIIYKAGGEQNAETEHDYTKYYATIPKENLIEVLEIEADRMQNLLIEAAFLNTP
jgi:zinc protease